MTKYWNQISERVDKLNLRERAMVFAAALLLVYTAMDTLLVAPVKAKHKAALAAYEQKQTEIKTMTEALQTAARSRSEGPDAGAAARLAQSRAKLAALENDARELSARLMAPERMREVLQQILARRPGLELVQMKTLPPSSVGGSADAQGQPAQPKPPVAAAQSAQVNQTNKQSRGAQSRVEVPPAGSIYKHGIQLTVRGSYLDLLAYLKEIESLPVRIYWDKLDLSVADYPSALLRVTLYTVSLDKTWMQV